MRWRPIILILAGCLAGPVNAIAQGESSDCQATFSTAELEFAAGRFYSIPELLKDCLDRNAFSNEQKVRVYELLTQVYLLTEEPREAENTYLKLLQADPEFVAIPERDPIDVVFLSKKFTTTPIFTPHFKAGGTVSNPAIIHEMSTISDPAQSTRVDTGLPGWTLGGGIDWNINPNLAVGSELMLSYRRFRTSTVGFDNNDDFQVRTEKQTWLDVPLYVKYGLHTGKVRPYGYAGYSVNLLLGDRLELSYSSVTGETVVEEKGPDEKIKYQRYFFNRSLVVGAGIKYKWGRNFFVLDVRYVAGQNNVARPEVSFYEKDPRNSSSSTDYTMNHRAFQYSDGPDFFRVNNWAFSAGYVMPLYDPRRVQRINTRAVQRQISKPKSR